MVNQLNDEIISKLDDIISIIKDSSKYKRFLEVQESMKNNKDITSKIERVKFLQKELIKTESKGKDTNIVFKEYNDLINELDSYPVYQEYKELLEELDDLYQEIKFILENHINNILS